jgi:hypothetical protein
MKRERRARCVCPTYVIVKLDPYDAKLYENPFSNKITVLQRPDGAARCVLPLSKRQRPLSLETGTSLLAIALSPDGGCAFSCCARRWTIRVGVLSARSSGLDADDRIEWYTQSSAVGCEQGQRNERGAVPSPIPGFIHRTGGIPRPERRLGKGERLLLSALFTRGRRVSLCSAARSQEGGPCGGVDNGRRG